MVLIKWKGSESNKPPFELPGERQGMEIISKDITNMNWKIKGHLIDGFIIIIFLKSLSVALPTSLNSLLLRYFGFGFAICIACGYNSVLFIMTLQPVEKHSAIPYTKGSFSQGKKIGTVSKQRLCLYPYVLKSFSVELK